MVNDDAPGSASGQNTTSLSASIPMGRRALLTGAASAALASAATAWGQGRDYGQNAAPVRYPDPDIIALDKRFEKMKLGNAAIQRLHTGMLWAEGPAWSGTGQFLVWSDIPNNRHMRWLPEDGHVSAYHAHSNNANGNTFDWEGRLVCCEHSARRVVRYEPNGAITVLADKWQGKPLNAPNDLIVHPDGGIWFTDPGYGSMFDYEGNRGELQIKEAVYRIDAKTGKMDKVLDEMDKPNGLCFSPDYKRLYIVDTGTPKNIRVYDLASNRLRNGRVFNDMKMTVRGKELHGNSDGIRADTEGNIWSAAGWVGEGYDGVHVFTPEGERIGQILLPEICSNVCFGGAKRNRLFMTASQSLYAVYVEAHGAHVA